MIKFDRRLILNFDWTLFSLVLLLGGIGLVNIYSTGFSLTDFHRTPLYVKQIQWILLGVAGMAVAFFVDYRFLGRHAYAIYGISVILLVVVSAAGYTTRGSQRWIAIGGFTFQPSELVKLTIILALAKYFDRHQLGRDCRLRELVTPLLIVMIPFLLILKQPDLGTALILLILFLSMVFFVGIDWRSLLTAGTGGVILAPIGWYLLKDYQKERILTFFDPERDPLGSGYHIIQSMIAVGSGGLFGKGFLKGSQTQLKFLPEQQTDFVFSVFAEEWGFVRRDDPDGHVPVADPVGVEDRRPFQGLSGGARRLWDHDADLLGSVHQCQHGSGNTPGGGHTLAVSELRGVLDGGPDDGRWPAHEYKRTEIHSAVIRNRYPRRCDMLGLKRTEEEEVRAFLGKGAEFTGKLMFNGSVRIDGDFKGDIFGNGTLVIGEGAEVEADIHVDTVLVSGEVRGQIDAKKSLKIYSPGKLLGDVNAPVFSVEEGAFFEGTCHMTRSEAEVHPLPLERAAAGEKR